MERTSRRFNRRALQEDWPRRDIRREWLVTNGLGGYASGTLDGVFTRRYHGLLIATLPIGRTMILNGLAERLRFPDRSVGYLGAEELTGVAPEKVFPVSEFRLENGLPVWIYEIGGYRLEKRLVIPYRQNTVHVIYKLLEGEGALRLGVRPAVNFRSHDAPVSTPLRSGYTVKMVDDQCEISIDPEPPVLRIHFQGTNSAFTFDRKVMGEIVYPLEEERGYESSGKTWSPGYYRADLTVGGEANFVASIESWDAILSMSSEQALETENRRRDSLMTTAPPAALMGFGQELVLAADSFLVSPDTRLKDVAIARAGGEEAWTVIAGYHWFTDWGRDTMISLEGLTLATGRYKEARWILHTFARYIRDGLIPNLFPEGADEGLYHTADATLWFFHALDRYVKVTGDRDTLTQMLPKLLDIVDHHVQGTRFGIHVDPADGLLSQGEEGYQLTWMDAKVGDWVVTPRRGKAVEINGLWYNALSLLEGWLRDAGESRVDSIRNLAEAARVSFNRRFWSEELGYLYDVVDGPNGDDSACRPNQLLSFSLNHPVLDRSKWSPVLEVVEKKLLTPFGLRSLSMDHPDYKAVYFGDLRSRDAAYHQGTVWAWLIGPFIDAWLKVHPADRQGARRLLEGFGKHLNEACVGSISEIFDGNSPYTPRGCIAQAWSVAEVLRCWILTDVS
ncbi:MAG TPA: amylo-alpha-1,6-glucosidase [Bryobacteraceae bacterium]|jgi:predicted glycogen debranching enzyme|nr:amylo-alpha-1,6-glucosidase [Bryobacteraceae bacterium]